MNPKLIVTEPTRHDKLKGWLHGRGLTIEKLAKATGLNENTCRWSLKRERASRERIELFLALGIPKSLLPKPWPRGWRGCNQPKAAEKEENS